MTSDTRVGWIGIGRMGHAMAERIAKAGADLTVWNRTRAKAEPLAALGAKIADDIAMIHKGRIQWHGAASKIDSSGNEYVEQFIHGRAQGPIQMEVLRG